MSDEEILPCPFCGAEPRVSEWMFDHSDARVYCPNPDCNASGPDANSTNKTWAVSSTHEELARISQEDAIAAWNHRSALIINSEPPLVSPTDPLRSEAAARDDARRMSSAHREHAQIAVDHSASVNRLLSIAEARAEALEAKFAKVKSVLHAARATLNSVVALDDKDAVEGSDLSASCQEIVRRIDAALSAEQPKESPDA